MSNPILGPGLTRETNPYILACDPTMNPKYRRMLNVMKEREARYRGGKNEGWTLYILECRDQSFYTGVTNNLERRLKAHQGGRASRFTRMRLPVKLLYQETCGSRTQALVRECAVKSLSRKEKEELITRGGSVLES